MSVRFLRTFLLFFCAIFFAQNSWAIPSIGKGSNASLPTVLKADAVDGDGVKNEIVATGNVEAKKDTSVIYADKMIYNKDGKVIRALGNVRVKNIEVGNMLVKEAEMKDDFSQGKFRDGKIFFNDGSYLNSPEIERVSPVKTVLQRPIFSFCPNPDISAHNEIAGQKRDFASIKTSKTTVDRGKQVMKSSHAFLRFFDIPVIYIPYMSVPLPGKKRESGFLSPHYLKTSNLGIMLETPYYFNIAPNKDLTLSPRFGLDGRQLILKNEFRHNTKYGPYKLDFEIANNEIKTVTDTTVIARTDKSYRWNVASIGEFDFTKNTGLDYNINTVSDRNYLRDYHFQYLAYTMSKANVDYVNGRSYHAMKTIRIQELEDVRNEKAAVFAMPILDSHIETKPYFFKEKLALTSNFTTINREDGLQYRRLTAIPEVQAPFNLRGNLFNLAARIQTDAYYLENNFKNIPRNNNYESTQTTYKPEISLKWRLPLIKKTKSNSLMLEPMASFVSSSYKKSFTKLPNEDSNPAELTVSNLFINDRIAGYDRNESGERLNYGAKTSFFNKYGEFGLIAGQSFRKSDEEQDVVIKGFAQNNKSNIVGQAMYKAQKYFSILYSFQLDQSNYRNDINQVAMGLNFNKFSLNSDYLLIRRTAQNTQKKEQASIGAKFDLANKWKLSFMVSRDLVLGRNLSRSLAILREGCCTIFGFSVVENNQSNLIKAQKTFNITLTFKNL